MSEHEYFEGDLDPADYQEDPVECSYCDDKRPDCPVCSPDEYFIDPDHKGMKMLELVVSCKMN